MDTDKFILSIKTQIIKKHLKISENIFDFSNLDENHEVFSYKNKKVFNKFKTETPKSFLIDKFLCLRSRAYSFKCKSDDEGKNKVKIVSKSQSKHTKFEEIKKSLDGETIKKIVIMTFFDHLILKYIFKN